MSSNSASNTKHNLGPDWEDLSVEEAKTRVGERCPGKVFIYKGWNTWAHVHLKGIVVVDVQVRTGWQKESRLLCEHIGREHAGWDDLKLEPKDMYQEYPIPKKRSCVNQVPVRKEPDRSSAATKKHVKTSHTKRAPGETTSEKGEKSDKIDEGRNYEPSDSESDYDGECYFPKYKVGDEVRVYFPPLTKTGSRKKAKTGRAKKERKEENCHKGTIKHYKLCPVNHVYFYTIHYDDGDKEIKKENDLEGEVLRD